MKRVCVTGGGGFVGSAVVRAMLARNIAVQVLTGRIDDPVADPPEGVPSVRGEITDGDAIARIANGCDTMVHLAGPASVGASFDSPAAYCEAHVAGTACVLDVCRKLEIKRFVYVSSAEVYGRAVAQPVSEVQPYDPRSPYAAAKAGAEQLVRAFFNTFAIAARILRPFSIYGSGQPPYALLPTIVRQAISGDRIALADLAPVRDYCYVDDVAEAVISACRYDGAGYAVFNVGTGVGTSVHELARAVLAAAGRDIPVVTAPSGGRPKAADIYELIADTKQAQTQLRWSAQTSLAQGLQKVIAFAGG